MFLDHAGGHCGALLWREAFECEPKWCLLPSRLYPFQSVCWFVRCGRDSEPMTGACFNHPPSLPVAEQVTAGHREPRPERTVVGETHPPAMHDQPSEYFVHGVECYVFACTPLLEVPHEAQRIAVVDEAHRLRLTPNGLEQVAISRVVSTHHLQTNTPPKLGQPTLRSGISQPRPR